MSIAPTRGRHHVDYPRKLNPTEEDSMRKAVTSFVTALVIGLPLAALAEMPPAGTVVTKDNLDKYKDSLNATQQYFVRNGMVVPVIEYQKYDWPPLYKEATEKYAS